MQALLLYVVVFAAAQVGGVVGLIAAAVSVFAAFMLFTSALIAVGASLDHAELQRKVWEGMTPDQRLAYEERKR